MDCKVLSLEEMDSIIDTFRKEFPDKTNLLIMHEKESKLVHTDIGILFGDKGSIILFTIGMSCTVMDNGKRSEIYVNLPEEAFLKRPKIDDNSEELLNKINPNYRFIFIDLFTISKMPAEDHEIYKDTDTLSVDTRIYGLRKSLELGLIDIFYLIQLSFDDLVKLSKFTNRNDEDIMSKRKGYLSKRIGLICGGDKDDEL